MKKIIILVVLMTTVMSCGVIQRARKMKMIKDAGYGNCRRVSDDMIMCSKTN